MEIKVGRVGVTNHAYKISNILYKCKKIPLCIVIKALQFLEKHKALNLFLVFVYGTALIFFHNFFVQLSVAAMNKLSLGVYNKLVLITSICTGAAALLLFVFYLLKNTENRVWKSVYGLVTLLLIGLHYAFLFEMNIEIIHAVEFAFLSLLLFPLTCSFGASVVFTLPFIFVNEWYQYTVLYPHYIHYFEFNDVVVDLLGCGLAMIMLWMAGKKAYSMGNMNKYALIFLAGLNILFCVLLLSCVLAQYPTEECNNTFLVLNKLENPHLFWQTHYFGQVYHVMKPVEGWIAINILCLFFTSMDWKSTEKRTGKTMTA